jgi:hypothetical protein
MPKQIATVIVLRCGECPHCEWVGKFWQFECALGAGILADTTEELWRIDEFPPNCPLKDVEPE